MIHDQASTCNLQSWVQPSQSHISSCALCYEDVYYLGIFYKYMSHNYLFCDIWVFRYDNVIMCTKIVCSSLIVLMILSSIGLTSAYDILLHNGSQLYSLKGECCASYRLLQCFLYRHILLWYFKLQTKCKKLHVSLSFSKTFSTIQWLWYSLG